MFERLHQRSNKRLTIVLLTFSLMVLISACGVHFSKASEDSNSTSSASSQKSSTSQSDKGTEPEASASASTESSSDNPKSSKATIIFTFDDGYQSLFKNALPIMKRADFKGTVYVNRDRVIGTNSEYMRLDHLKSLYKSGWDISNHTTNHAGLSDNPSPTEMAALKESYLDNQKWIVQNVGKRGAYHVAYPNSLYTEEVIKYLKGIGVLTARTTDKGNITTPLSNEDDYYRLQVRKLLDATALETARDSIQEAMKDGSTVIFMIHQVRPESSELDLGVKDLKVIVNEVKELQNAGKLTVMTISEWYEALN